MNFDLTAEQAAFRGVVREFANEVVAPRSAEADLEEKLPLDVIKQMGELGLFGLPFPAAVGGSDADAITVCLALEELGRVDQSVAITLARGEALGGFGLTEPGAGSDAAEVHTTGRFEGGEWIVDGSKAFITNSGSAISTFNIVAAATEPAGGPHGISTIIVPTDTPGFEAGPAYRKLGWRASETHELVFRDCHVPQEHLLGQRGRGFSQCLAVLADGRIGVAALSIGLAQGCLDEAVKYALQREAFGRPIGAHQAIQFKIADMHARVETARLATYRAAWLKDEGKEYVAAGSLAKLVASEAAVDNAREAVQIHGGYGFIEDFPVARFYRDAKVLEIGEGTSEIHRLILARDLGLPETF
jgi:alkylation response protein AidB-like acyl-CoA dehydrogenase